MNMKRIMMVVVGLLAGVNLVNAQTWVGPAGSTWSQPDDVHFSPEYTSGSTATFTATGAGTVMIDAGGVTPGNVIVNSTANYTFGGGSIGGTGSLTKSGSGMLIITNANSFSGGVILNQGILRLQTGSTAASLGDPANVVTFTGSSTLDLQGVNPTFAQSFAVNEGVTADFYGNDGRNFIINGELSGAGTLQVRGNGSYIVYFTRTNNTFNGNITIGSGSSTYTSELRINSLDDTPGRSIKLGSTTRGGVFSYGAGAVVPLVINQRQIELAGTTGGGAIKNYAADANATVTINTNLLVTGVGNKTFTLGGSNTGKNTFPALVTDGAGSVISLTKADAGRWILANTNNSYTGITTISGGTLEVTKLANGGVNSPIGASSSAASNLKLGGWASLRYTGSGDSTDRDFTFQQTAGSQSFTLDASGTGAINFTSTNSPVYTASNYNAILNLNGTSTANNTFAGIVKNSGSQAVRLEKDGIGTWVFLNESTCTGGTTIKGGGTLVLDYSTPGSKLFDTAWLTLSGGTLTLKGGTGLTEVVAGTSVSAGATFITRDGGDTVLQLKALGQSAGGNISFLDGTVAMTTTANNGSGMFGAWATVGNNFACNDGTGKIVAYSGATTALPLSGGGSGSANYTLSGDQTQSGTADLYIFTLKISGTGVADNTLALGGTNLRITNNADSNEGGILYTGGGTGVYNITANTGKGIYTSNISRDLTINTVAGTLQINATLGSGQTSATLLKAGAGTLVLSSANTYTLTTYVNEGALRLANDTAAGTTAGGIQVQNNAALELSGSINVGTEALTLTGTGVSNGGALRNKSGSNTYGGTVTLANLGGARINSDSGASLTLTNASSIVTALFRDVTIGGEGDTTVLGAISGAGSLVKDCAGTLTLLGVNTYSGDTTVNGGTLALGGHNVLNGKAIALNGGTLDAGTYTNTLSTLTVSGSSTLALNAGTVLAFADCSAVQWSGTLNITGALSAGTSLRFGTSSSGLTEAQLASLTATGYTISIDSNGYITGTAGGTLIYFK